MPDSVFVFSKSSWILFFIVLFSMFNQWIRWLPTYLSSVMLEECEDLCSLIPFTPICESCSPNDSNFAACNACLECRIFNHHEFYNLQDGTCMSTSDYGVLTGFGFSLTFGLFGVVAGYIIDKRSETYSTRILGLFSMLCGFITFTSSICQDFTELLLLRSLLGGFQAFIAPVTVCLISLNFNSSADKLIANGAYTIGVYLGAGLCSLTTIIAAQIGWRLASKFVGYTCVLTAIAYAFILDADILFLGSTRLNGRISINEVVDYNEEEITPILHHRHSSETHSIYASKVEEHEDDSHFKECDFIVDKEENNNDSRNPHSSSTGDRINILPSASETSNQDETSDISLLYSFLPEAFKSIHETLFAGEVTSRTLLLLLFGSSMRFSASIAMFVYTPIVIARKFPEEELLYSVINSISIMVCGSTSALLGGKIGRYVIKHKGLSGLTKLLYISCGISVLFFVYAILSKRFWTSMISLSMGYLVGEFWMCATMALLQSLCLQKHQGMIMGIYLLLNWNASAVMTEIIGFLDPGTLDISYLLAKAVATSMGISALIFILLDLRIIKYHCREEERSMRDEEVMMKRQTSLF